MKIKNVLILRYQRTTYLRRLHLVWPDWSNKFLFFFFDIRNNVLILIEACAAWEHLRLRNIGVGKFCTVGRSRKKDFGEMGSVRTFCCNLQAMNGDLRLGAFSKQTFTFALNLCLHFFKRMWSNRKWSYKGQKQESQVYNRGLQYNSPTVRTLRKTYLVLRKR